MNLTDAFVVQIQMRTVYGNDLLYPVNQTARDLAELTGKKTLDRRDLAIIRRLGFVLETVQSKITL